MNEAGLNSLLADFILIVHFCFVLFVIIGFFIVVFGRFIGWSWIYQRIFRIGHLAAIIIVVAQTYFGRFCPLTIWENALRARTGQGGYEESFIQHWLQHLLYYDAELWQFGVIYTIFGVLVVAAVVLDWKKINRKTGSDSGF